MTHRHHKEDCIERVILREVEETHREVEEIERQLRHPRIVTFTRITQEPPMVSLAAGQTATFSTTPIPATAAPDPSKVIWTSSDSVNAPVSPNPADNTGLSTLVVFPEGTQANISFALTVSYTNADGTVANKTNTFTTVAPPPTDVTGFTDIVQSA